MNSGLLAGYAQRVKVSFDFLDIDNNGWFALKDLTERGKHISSYLGLGLDLTSTFSIMDAFRSFDVGIRGRVRLEDFGVSLIIRMLSYDESYYNKLAHDAFEAGFTSVAKFLTVISTPTSKSTQKKNDDIPSSPVGKIFSAVPFSSNEEGGDSDGFGDDFTSVSSLSLPSSLKNSMGTLLYLLEDTLIRLSGGIESDVPLTEALIEKVFRDTLLLACRELKIQLQLSQAYIEKVWSEKGHELNEQTIALSAPWDPMGNKHRKVNLELLWKSPRKTEFGTRVQYEMTDATSLKGQFRRSGSILASNTHDIKSRPSVTYESALGGRENVSTALESEAGHGENMPFSIDELMLQDLPPLDSSQLFVLKTAIQNIDNFFTILRNPNMTVNDQDKRDKMKGEGRPKSRFQVAKGNTPAQSSTNKMQTDVSSDDSCANKQLESELSLELMETHDKLRRTSTRLEILEIIQMHISENVSKAVAKGELRKKKEESDNSDTENDDQDADNEDTGSIDHPAKLTVSEGMSVAESKEVTFDDIMASVQAVRALVSQRGTENMTVGSLLATPSAIVPLQDVEDNKKSAFSSKTALVHGVGEEKSQSPIKGILSKGNQKLGSNGGRINKKIQVASLIQLMNTSIVSISEEMSTSNKRTGDMEKLKLLARNNEEKAAEAAVFAEQLSRQDDSAAALSVEIQVLRDRIQHVSAMEHEIDNLKEKNLHLNRQVKELERNMSERKEGWGMDNLLPDGDDIEGSSKTLVDLENKVLNLKEENNELKAANAKLMKEQRQHIMASKNAEKRLKLCLQDNLGLNQKMNRLEEDYNNSKIEVSDLLGQIEHQRDTEQERLQVAKKLHTTGLLVTELRGKLLEAKAEALHANKLREELSIAESRVSKLMEAASEAEITSDSNLSAKQEVEELNILLREKMRENRELSITVRSLERKVNEGKTVQARLVACQDEVNRYKIKVEQCAPMLAEVARLRGAARAAVRALQEQDKTIVTAEDTNKKLRKKLEETTISLKRMEKIESKLIESESECARLSDIVLTEIPQLKEELTNVNHEKSQIETQYRHIKKSSRQSAVTGSGLKDMSSGPVNSTSSSGGGGSKSAASPSPSAVARKQSVKPPANPPTQSSPSVSSRKQPVKPPANKSSPTVSTTPPTAGKKPPPTGSPAKKALPPPPKKKEEDDKSKPPPPKKIDGGSTLAQNKASLLAKFKPPGASSTPSADEKPSLPPSKPRLPPPSEEIKPPPPPPPSSSSSSTNASDLPAVDDGGSMADNKAALLSLFKPR